MDAHRRRTEFRARHGKDNANDHLVPTCYYWANPATTFSQPTFLDGYCSTVQGLLDWFEVDIGFPDLISFKLIQVCVFCVFKAKHATTFSPPTDFLKRMSTEMSVENKFQIKKLYSRTRICHSVAIPLIETATSGGVSRSLPDLAENSFREIAGLFRMAPRGHVQTLTPRT